MRHAIPSSKMILVLLAATVAGCGKSGPQPVPVSGQVLIDGEPVANATIQVAPTDARAAMGQTDEQGNFTLTTYEKGDGCVKGTHRVVVSAITYPSDTQEVLHVPEKYMDLATTDLEVTIDEPTEDLKIELTWGGRPGPITRRVEAE